MHYRVVPGLRETRYVESRSGKNGCLFVSEASHRAFMKTATANGFDNPLAMLKAAWLKRVKLERRAAA
jgi:hypothetical protein